MLIEPTNAVSFGPDRPRPILSVIVPCFNEELNLPLLYERVRTVLDAERIDWEMIAVDDHSRDGTFQVAIDLTRRDSRVRTLRLARNVGSHIALMCGLDHVLGRAAVMIAADMQDPPDIILELLARWRQGDQVVWAVRSARRGVSATSVLLSRLFYKIMERIIGHGDMAGHGADVFLVDRVVIDALTECRESNLSLFSLLSWLGFRQSTVSYIKQERQHGRSGWSFKKKLKLFIDSITSFSYFPIRLMSLLGIGFACLGFLYAFSVAANAILVGIPVEGWSSLMIVVLVVGGLQMTMLGVLGEYIWRALDETRRRPRYNVECVAGSFDYLQSTNKQRPNETRETILSSPAQSACAAKTTGREVLD